MNPVAVLEALVAFGCAPEALDAVGRNIIALEVVSVQDLVAVGLSGQDIIAVRRALDPSVGSVLMLLAFKFISKLGVTGGSRHN